MMVGWMMEDGRWKMKNGIPIVFIIKGTRIPLVFVKVLLFIPLDFIINLY